MKRAIARRLDKLESLGPGAAPTTIFAGRPLAEGEPGMLLANWREEIAQGRASLCGPALFIKAPLMTVAEWVAEQQ